MLNWS